MKKVFLTIAEYAIHICAFILALILAVCSCYAETVKSPDVRALYRVESDYIEKSETNIGLEIVDLMQVRVLWDAYDGKDVVDAEAEFPIVPEDLAMVILTDGVHIAQAQWDLTSGHSLHVYFYKEDLEPFVEKEVMYLMMIRFANGLYFNVF